jgi:cytochrome c553
MKKPNSETLVNQFVVFILFIIVSISVQASGYDAGDTKKGAQLYDKWTAVVGKKSSGNHPLYPASAKKKGGVTWRCKECHGWDYIGKDGRYKKGSHFTGIKGVMDLKGKAPKTIYSSLTSGKHDYSKMLSSGDIWSLVKFIKEGTVDAAMSMGSGNAANGKKRFAKSCALCHGPDGNKLDFKPKKDGIQGVGWLANDNPQESLHKIRWGHPGSPMPSGTKDLKFSEKDVADVLAYSLTLK